MGQKIKILNESDLKQIISECVKKALNEAEKKRFGQLMHVIGKNMTKAIANYADLKEEAGEVYTREELISVAEKVFNHYNKQYPSIPKDTPSRIVDYFIEKHRSGRDFLVAESKKVKKLNEAQLKKMINESVKRILKEGLPSLPGYDRWKTSVPDSWDEPTMINKDDFLDMIKTERDERVIQDFVEWVNDDCEPEVCESVMQAMKEGRNVFIAAIKSGVDWKEICENYFDIRPVNYYPSDMEDY